MTVKKSRLLQACCLAAATLLLWPPPFWPGASRITVQASPFVAICGGIAARSIGAGMAAGLVVAIAGIFRRRWFCRYVCPVGLLLDGCAKIGWNRTHWWRRCPALGASIAILTLGGSVVGYPLLLWLDPLAILSNSFALRSAVNLLSAVLGVLGLLILILLSITSGPLWCVRLCPLGGTLDLLASLKNLLRVPQKALAMPEQCSKARCAPESGGRRSFILTAAGFAAGLLGVKLGAARGEYAPLRPPGAVHERRFSGLCVRCGNCVRSCPSKIIHADDGQAGIAGLLAPAVRFRTSYCREDCAACTQVCPSGALRPLTLQEKNRYPIGEALLDGALCVLALGQRDCDACERACPFGAIRIHWDEEQYIAYPVVESGKCNGCGACEAACPAHGDKAIRVWKKAG